VEIWSQLRALGANVENLTIAGNDAYGRGNELNQRDQSARSGDPTRNAAAGNDISAAVPALTPSRSTRVTART
jgi:hypothetical protein